MSTTTVYESYILLNNQLYCVPRQSIIIVVGPTLFCFQTQNCFHNLQNNASLNLYNKVPLPSHSFLTYRRGYMDILLTRTNLTHIIHPFPGLQMLILKIATLFLFVKEATGRYCYACDDGNKSVYGSCLSPRQLQCISADQSCGTSTTNGVIKKVGKVLIGV
jgi:hypothetical protein